MTKEENYEPNRRKKMNDKGIKLMLLSFMFNSHKIDGTADYKVLQLLERFLTFAKEEGFIDNRQWVEFGEKISQFRRREIVYCTFESRFYPLILKYFPDVKEEK